MNPSSCQRFARLAGVGVAILLAHASLPAQTTTSSISGQVNSAAGASVAGAAVDIIYTPTNSTVRTTTNSTGRFTVGGLNVGGPYEVRVEAPGFRLAVERGITLELSKTYRTTIVLGNTEDIVELEEFVVEGTLPTVFETDAMGTGTIVDGEVISNTANVRRAISDFARLNPLVVLGDSDRLEINAAGQHYRQNSIQVDGVNLNDQFGLEASGLPSLNNPISINTIEQFNVEISPYDVRQSGFTGAAINAVTRSGTNTFSGEVYYYYSNDDLRGEDVNTGTKSPYTEKTYGFSIGGPIWKDRIFFFYNYENFEKELAPSSAAFIPDATAVTAIRNRLLNLSAGDFPGGYDPGVYGGAGTAQELDEKHFLKVDFVLNQNHRLTARYAETIAVSPNFGRFSNNGQTSLSSNYYTNAFKTQSYGIQAFSRWTDRFETEVSVARDTFDKIPSRGSIDNFPQIEIQDVPGMNAGGGATEGTLFLGSENSRQANELATETDKAKAIGTFYMDRHTITFGFDTEKSKFDNLFAQNVYGNLRYAEVGGVSGYDRFITPGSTLPQYNRPAQVAGTELRALSDYSVTGLFVQDRFDVTDRLQLLYGLRYDFMGVDKVPFTNTLFNNTFVANDGRKNFDNAKTIDGSSQLGARFGFRYEVDEEKRTLLRGGVGLFQGKVPGVYISNAYSNTGVTIGSLSYASGFTLEDYLATFDKDNPIAVVPGATPGASAVNILDPGFELPSVWRGNLALDQKLFGDWIGTIELVRTEVNKGVYMENLNLKKITPAGGSPDGRQHFAGTPGSASNANDPNFTNVYSIRNTSNGSATNVVLSIAKPLRNNWWANASYTYTQSTDVSSITSSTASSNFNNRAVFNQNEDVAARSNYEFKHRILINAGYRFEWSEGWRTRVGLTYEGKTGRPYSYVFRGDYNGDGVSFNDLFYVPNGPSDPLITYRAGTTQAEIDRFYDFLNTSGLVAYAGTAVPRNSEASSFAHRFDLSFTQEVPLHGRFRAEFFCNIINVGNLLNSDWGQLSEVPFSFTAGVAGGRPVNGRIEYDLRTAPQGEQTVANRSQWAIQVGATLKF